MAKEEAIEVTGEVVQAERNQFRVKLDGSESVIIATPGGKLRVHNIKIVLGDRVKVELSPYDLTRGRIVYRDR